MMLVIIFEENFLFHFDVILEADFFNPFGTGLFCAFHVVVVVVVVIIPSLPRNGGTARTAIQVHAFNLIEIRLGERWQPISNQS